MAETTHRSWQEAFTAQLAEQNINIDPSYAPADADGALAWLDGDGTHLAGTALEAYVEAWTWHTLRPLVELALASTEFDPSADAEWSDSEAAGASEGEEQIDEYPTWVHNLLVAADLADVNIDPYGAPPGDKVVALIRSNVEDASVWPDLDQLLGATSVDERAAFAGSLQSALDQIGPPPGT
ncbi:MAG: hypothetical protein M3527_05995 [Actinomycetota bacterium]|nr:hypothetical protein [Acidimicrobiia bacterium]MDQ3293982.1 hypothetical protein [Actinomycetota bacterium]